jgi:Photosynthetic reaction centre cytochrome C subunit
MRQVRSSIPLLLLIVLTLTLAVSAQTPPAQVPPGGPPTERWKPEKLTNLKVLPKETTPDQIMEIMQHFRRSLNIGCLGCHKGQQGQPISTFDFADDSKENKDIARKMIKLTDDLNTKYADAYPDHDDTEKAKARVTCASCHRGKRHVETEPPPPPGRPEGPPPVGNGANKIGQASVPARW